MKGNDMVRKKIGAQILHTHFCRISDIPMANLMESKKNGIQQVRLIKF